MTKKIFAVMLALVMVLALTACGGGNKQAIVGTWELTDGDGGDYGVAIKFNKDGTMTYGLGSGGDYGVEGMEDALKELEGMLEIKYKIKSDTVMEVTASALFGLAKETTEVSYSLSGDTLSFDGSAYRRIK